MISLILVFITFATLCSATTKIAVAQKPSCKTYPKNRIYTLGECYKTETGSTMWSAAEMGCYRNVTYTTPDCTGKGKETVAFDSWYTEDPKFNNIAFMSDKNKGCEDGEKIDGVYYNDQCFPEGYRKKYVIVEENGKSYLKLAVFTGQDCNSPVGNYEESYTCNKCTNGVLVKCYGVDTPIDMSEAYDEDKNPSSPDVVTTVAASCSEDCFKDESLNRYYTIGKCKRTGTGSTLWKYEGYYTYTNKTYNTPDCTGAVTGSMTSSSGTYHENPTYKNIAYISDKNKGCELGEEIDGIYVNSFCYANGGRMMYVIDNSTGTTMLRLGVFHNKQCSGNPEFFIDDEDYVCNKCTKGVLVKCFDINTPIDRTEAYEDGETPSPGFDPSQNPDSDENTGNGDDTNGSNNQENGSLGVTLAFVALVVTALI